MAVTDAQDVLRDVNPAYEKLTGYRKHEVIGMPIMFNHSGAEDEDTVRRMRDRLAANGVWEGQFWLRNRAGEAFSEKVLRRIFVDPGSGERGILTVSLDLGGSEEEKRLMLWQAHHDTLTKLPNRNLFQERFTRVVMNLKSDGHGVVLAIDLDNFKIINDSQGAAKGDQLLTQVAFRIATAAAKNDTVARLAGDHFAVLI
ncbi:MAG: diguanylate cyclase [Gammaproteobacteria bacterium]|nr:diguanylate cyclase [Gammaproteobacteria bacterium]